MFCNHIFTSTAMDSEKSVKTISIWKVKQSIDRRIDFFLCHALNYLWYVYHIADKKDNTNKNKSDWNTDMLNSHLAYFRWHFTNWNKWISK